MQSVGMADRIDAAILAGRDRKDAAYRVRRRAVINDEPISSLRRGDEIAVRTLSNPQRQAFDIGNKALAGLDRIDDFWRAVWLSATTPMAWHSTAKSFGTASLMKLPMNDAAKIGAKKASAANGASSLDGRESSSSLSGFTPLIAGTSSGLGM